MSYREEIDIARRVLERDLFQRFTAFIDKSKGENTFPKRQDIDLMSEYRLARNIYIFDVRETPPKFEIRFVGSNIVSAFGFDPTGRYLEDLGFLESKQEICDGYSKVVRDLSPHLFLNPIKFDEPAITPFKKDQTLIMARFAFPVIGADGRADRIIGAMDFLPYDEFQVELLLGVPIVDADSSAKSDKT